MKQISWSLAFPPLRPTRLVFLEGRDRVSIQNRNQTWGGALAPRSVPELSLLGLGQLLWVRWPHFAPRSVPPLPSSPQVSPPRAPRSAPRAFPLGRVCIPPQVPGHALWGAAAGPPWGDISGARYAQTLTHSSWAWGLSSNAGLAYLPPPTPVLLTVCLSSLHTLGLPGASLGRGPEGWGAPCLYFKSCNSRPPPLESLSGLCQTGRSLFPLWASGLWRPL